MTATQIKDLTLDDVITQLHLTQTHDQLFFEEWQTALPPIESQAEQQLQQIQTDYEYLSRKVLDEGSVDFSLRNPGDLTMVLQIMRRLGEIVQTWGI